MDDAHPDIDTQSTASTSNLEPGSASPSVAPTRDRLWKVRIRGRKMAIMWSMTAILGGAFISLATGPPRLLLPVGLLVTYTWYGYHYVKGAGDLLILRRTRLSQLADSVYFLGFLWTLYALIDSFAIQQLDIAGAVFRAFGYALVTTATGMFIRLFLLQFAYSEEGQVRSGQLAVEEEIGRFSKEVRCAIVSISGFREKTDDALTGWINSLNKSTRALKTSVDNVQVQTDGLKKALMEMNEAHAKELDKLVETAVSQFIQTVAPSFEALSNANGQFVKDVNTCTTKIETVVDTAVNRTEKAVDTGMAQIMSYLSQGAGAISNSLQKSVQSIETSTAVFTESLLKQMGKLEATLVHVLKQIREIRVPADIVEKAVSNQLDKVNVGLEESTRMFQDAINNLASSVLSAAERVRDTRHRRAWWKFWA